MKTYENWIGGRGFTEQTISARVTFYRSRLRDWGTWDLDETTISSWLGQYAGWTRLTYHNHLTSIYAWLVEERAMDVSPLAGIKRPPTPRPRPKPLTEEQLRHVLLASTPRTRAFLMLGYLAGFRAFEIAKMHGREIDGQRIHVFGKGGTDDYLPTHELLWDLAQQFPRDDWWFPPLTRRVAPHIGSATVTYHVGRLFRSLGVTGATHRARHTYGTQMLRGGANLRVVQELMRHRSLATTALYLGVDEDERRAAINSLAA